MGWEGGTIVAAAGGVAAPAPAIAAPCALALAFIQSLSLAFWFASQLLALVSSCLCLPALARTGLVVRVVVCARGRCCCPRYLVVLAWPLFVLARARPRSFVL
jgi:hypothetical protein